MVPLSYVQWSPCLMFSGPLVLCSVVPLSYVQWSPCLMFSGPLVLCRHVILQVSLCWKASPVTRSLAPCWARRQLRNCWNGQRRPPTCGSCLMTAASPRLVLLDCSATQWPMLPSELNRVLQCALTLRMKSECTNFFLSSWIGSVAWFYILFE